MLHFRNAVTYICPYCITGTKQTKTDKNIFKITTAIKVTKKQKKLKPQPRQPWTESKLPQPHSQHHWYLNLLERHFKCERFIKVRIQRFSFNCRLFLLESFCSMPKRNFDIWIWVEKCHTHISHVNIISMNSSHNISLTSADHYS